MTALEWPKGARADGAFTFHPRIIGRPSRLGCLREPRGHARQTPGVESAAPGEISAHGRGRA